MQKHLITFLIDTSGSMYDKLESVKEALVRFQLELEDGFYILKCVNNFSRYSANTRSKWACASEMPSLFSP